VCVTVIPTIKEKAVANITDSDINKLSRGKDDENITDRDINKLSRGKDV
jgi:hypothetical protein